MRESQPAEIRENEKKGFTIHSPSFTPAFTTDNWQWIQGQANLILPEQFHSQQIQPDIQGHSHQIQNTQTQSESRRHQAPETSQLLHQSPLLAHCTAL